MRWRRRTRSRALSSPRPPSKACCAGALSKGVGAGVGILLAAPAAGAANEGTKGFFKGLGVGVVGAVAASGAGVAGAAYQIGRGIAAVPEGFEAEKAGKDWDPKTETWWAGRGAERGGGWVGRGRAQWMQRRRRRRRRISSSFSNTQVVQVAR
eukprot:SAG11_NODE_387_length_9883_cov_9.365699_8_plen_153_part_00